MKKTKMKIYNWTEKSIIYKAIYITLFSNPSLRQKVYYQQILIKGGADISAYTGPCRVFKKNLYFGLLAYHRGC